MNKIIKLVTIILLMTHFTSKAQWVNDSRVNTPLVINLKEPTDIIVLPDSNGGAFIVLQDLVTSNINNVFFHHFNKKGQVSFHSEGKSVSLSQFNKIKPVAVITPKDEVIILWKEIISSEKQSLSAQKINYSGQRLWTDFGIQIEKVEGDIVDYSLSASSNGEVLIVLISKKSLSQKISKTIFKLNNDGKIISKKVTHQKSEGIIIGSQILTKDSQSAGLFWIESINNKSVLKFKFENLTDKETKIPTAISNLKDNVLDFSVLKIKDGFYVIWTVLAQTRRIYHQLISSKGVKNFGNEGKLISTLKGSNYNPRVTFYNNRILVTYVNEFNKDQNIYADAFDLKGERIWDKKPLSIIDIKGDQFGQQIVSDNKGGFIVAWIDRRKGKDFGNIYSQKFSLDKKLLWDSLGVNLGTSQNSQKSYLNLIEDKSGGAIAIFKDKINDICEIYGQRVFSTGTFEGQILGLKSELLGDSVKISWYAVNESDLVEYNILRKKNNTNRWDKIATLQKIRLSTINYYEYFDFPNDNGLFSYSIVQKINGRENQLSDITSVNYIKDVTDYLLFQNSPNPFSDKTTISFAIPAPQRVELEIFDIRLNPIKLLVNESFPAGKHSIVFHADELVSGIYFYRMKAGDFISVKKMVVTK